MGGLGAYHPLTGKALAIGMLSTGSLLWKLGFPTASLLEV